MDNPQLTAPIARGRTAEVFAWRSGQVLKLFYAAVPSSWVEHEIAVGRVVAERPVPAARFLGVEQVGGRAGIIYERVEGESMLAALSRRPWQLARLARQMAETHAAIHRQSGAGLEPLNETLRRVIGKAQTLTPQLRGAALRALDGLPNGAALLHFDFHPDQVLLSPGGARVIDWTNAVQGDPAGDVARTQILLTTGDPLDANLGMRLLARFARGAFWRAYLRRYLQLNPAVRLEQVRQWVAPVAAARLNEGIPGDQEKMERLIRQAAV